MAEPSLLHEPTRDNTQFDPVSCTAKIVGYLRGLDRSLQITDGLSLETQGNSLMTELGILDPETQAAMAVLFQSRYHAINAAIARSREHIRQIVEFASGISPRGLQWSRMSPGTIYVESDLPHLMIHKAKLVRNAIVERNEERFGLLHCCAVNVLDSGSILDALNAFDPSIPFTIVTEGLLLYFDVDELGCFFRNIHGALARHPGSVWVTDIVSKNNLQELLDSHSGVAEGVRRIFSRTGREVVPHNPFESEKCIERCLAQHGLKVESTVALRDVTANLNFNVSIPLSERRGIVGSRKIWRLAAAG